MFRENFDKISHGFFILYHQVQMIIKRRNTNNNQNMIIKFFYKIKMGKKIPAKGIAGGFNAKFSDFIFYLGWWGDS